MFEKNLKLAYLLDFYGEALDEQTRTMMTAYYDDDLSLAEIADGVGISRQGVRHTIKKGEEQLTFLEDRLGLAEHHERLEEAAALLDGVIDLLDGYDGERIAEAVAVIKRTQDMIINK